MNNEERVHLQRETFDKFCAWLLIPHGRKEASATGAVRYNARLMFRQSGLSMSSQDVAVLGEVFANWPEFLSRSNWQPNVYKADENLKVWRLKPDTTRDLKSLYQRYFESLDSRDSGAKTRWKNRLFEAKEIWRAAFPEAGRKCVVYASPKPDDATTKPHSETADFVAGIYGGLHALSVAVTRLAPGLPTHAGVRAYNLKDSRERLLREGSPMVANLSQLSDSLNGPADRRTTRDSLRPNREPPAQKNVLSNWLFNAAPSNSVWKFDKRVGETGRTLRGDSAVQKLFSCLHCSTPDNEKTRQDIDKVHGARDQVDSIEIAREIQKIAHHGWLMRHLGLVLEMTIADSEWEEAPRVVAGSFQPGVVVADAEGHAAPNPAREVGLPQRAGVIELGPRSGKRFKLLQLDVETAARKLVQAASTQKAQEAAGAEPDVLRYETSAQVSNGITLVDTDNVGREKSLKRQQAPVIAQATGHRLLYAEDITSGIRPDVRTQTVRTQTAPKITPWKSLTGWKIRDARINSRDITGHFNRVEAGESVVGASSRMVAAEDGKGEVKPGAIGFETLFTWDGWSLAAGHPDPGADGRQPAFLKLEVGDLVVTLAASGDLPALRVGRGYQVAARAVYLDGVGPSLDDARLRYRCEGYQYVVGLDPETGDAQAFFPCMRYEVLLPPAIHLGEHLDYARFPQASASKAVLATSSNPAHVNKREIRYVVPPAISLEQAVALGQYDSAAMRQGPPVSAFKGVCLTRSGRVPNASSPAFDGEPRPTRGSSAGDKSDTLFRRSPLARDPVIPYLPDPWARMVIIAAYRSGDNELLAAECHDYYEKSGIDAWPQCEPLKIEIVRSQDYYISVPQNSGSAKGRVDFKKEGGTLKVIIPPGEDLRLHLWHEIDEDMLEKSAIVDQMAAYLYSADGQRCCEQIGITQRTGNLEQTRKALINRLSQWQEMRDHPIRREMSRLRAKGLTNITSFGMINPSQELRVVHAVEQPLAPHFLWSGLPSEEVAPNVREQMVMAMPFERLLPFEQSFRLAREPGRSDAVLRGDLRIDRQSTARVDIALSWKDFTDRIENPAPVQESKNAVVTIDHLPAMLKKSLDAAPNSRAYPDQAPDHDLILLDGVRSQLGRIANEDLGERRLTVGFGDGRARVVDLKAVAQSRFAAEFPKNAHALSEAGVITQMVCPATVVPPPPNVDFVMPQYRWLQNSSGHTAHERVGGCFRVWLNRPWFSSGVDERLAVVCWPPEMFDKSFLKRSVHAAVADFCGINRDPPVFLEPFVTRWGLDPLWSKDRGCVGSIPPEAFRNHVCDVSDIAGRRKSEACFPVVDLRECEAMKPHIESYQAGSAKVALVLYAPKYDTASRRHYVDIQIDEQYAYFPFVRLTMARYQQYALPGYELSEISVQEFVQLPPGRKTSVTVKRESRTHNSATVKLALEMRGSAPGPVAPLDVEQPGREWNTFVTARLDYLPKAVWESMRSSVPGELGMHGVAWVPQFSTTVLLVRDKARGRWTLSKDDADFKPVLSDANVYSVLIEEFERGWEDTADRSADEASSAIAVRRSIRRVFSDRLLLPDQS